MKWTSLYLKNFLSIQEAHLKLDNRGLVLIEGNNKTNGAFTSNASGKTALLDALVYAIYDTTSKGIKADDVVNRTIGKNTAVILEGKKGNDTYRIERYRKHTKYKNKVKLFVNDKEISEKSTKDTNATIEKIVGIDYNTFINSIMFSQGNGAGRFANATDKEKKEILENVVNLSVYAKAQELAKERLKKKQDEINENKRQIERISWELSNVDLLEQQDQENYQQTKNLIDSETKNLENTMNEFTKYIEGNATTLNETEEVLNELKSKRAEISNISITDITNEVNNLFQEIKQKELTLQNLTNKKNEIVEKYKKVKSEVNCPVCGNPLDPVHRDIELQKLERQLREILININNVTSDIESQKWDYHVLYTEYQNKKEIHDNINAEFRKITDEINQKESWIQNYEATKKNYQDKIEHIKSTLEKLRNIPEPRPRDEERKAIHDKIQAKKQSLLELEREKSKLEDVVKVYSNSGVKSHILDLITPFLNERANKYLATLSGSNIEITFSTQKQNKNGEFVDKFDIQVNNAAGGETYQSNSEGEKKRIDLAISLAIQDLVLQKASIASNVVIYDEVFDALDSVGAENVVKLLRERLETVPTIFVITHSEHLKDLFEQVITVTKNKEGISSVSEGAGAP